MKSNIFTSFLFVALVLLSDISLYSLPPTITFFSTSTSGDWKNGTQWNIGSSPSFNQTNGNDEIIIDNNHKITLTDNLSVKSGTIITVTSNDTLQINGNVIFANGSIVNVDGNGVLIINGNLTNNNNSNTITINGMLILNGNFSGGNGSEVNGTGAMDISGTVTTSGSGAVFGSTVDCSFPGACSSSFSTPLPIVLTNFDVSIIESTVKIEWITSTETNNDFFTIEKSKDGINWGIVEKIKGAGNSYEELKYQTIDFSPIVGQSYYRLKQTDFNGEYSYSNLVNVFYNKEQVKFYPNPFTNSLSIKNNCNECLITIYSSLGQVIYSGNDNMINTENWPKGVYQVVINDNNSIVQNNTIIK